MNHLSDQPLEKLTTAQMATFAARGFLRLDGIVPEHINQQFLADVGDASTTPMSLGNHYRKIMQDSVVPLVRPGTPLYEAYPQGGALANLLALPDVRGAIASLVGKQCVVDHHFLHITFPPHLYPTEFHPLVSQYYHQDSTIDPRQAFDVQLLYFPHEVTVDMGGTRFVPGTHFRVVSEAAIARYQNIIGQEHVVCPAGTVIFFHMGIWHGAGLNQSESLRYMFKIRMCPTAKQERLWDVDDEANQAPQRPLFWTDPKASQDDLYAILMRPERWFEMDTGRLEFLNRARFWRYISADKNFDADYWLTRVENEYV